MEILPLEDNRIREAARLVARVFPGQSLTERLTFPAWRRRHRPAVRRFLRMAGIAEILGFWVAVDDGRIIGTTGLYTMTRDEGEAIWLAWFCVDPAARGRGVGKALMERSLEEACKQGKSLFRLYTSDVPNEAKAQFLYERYGFRVVRKKRQLFYTKIYRERPLP